MTDGADIGTTVSSRLTGAVMQKGEPMDDTISRAAAITEIMEDLNDRSLHDDPGTPEDYAEGYDEGIRNAAAIVLQMPSAQPVAKDINVPIKDCISRQAAIDALDEIEAEVADGYGYQYAKWREYFAKMQSAQPDIIRCRNCKFASGDSRICMKFDHSPIGELDFCAWAERRTDE